MKILQIAARLPYPLTDGGAVGIYKATEATAKAGADITFVTYPEIDAEVTRRGVEKMSEFAEMHLCSKPLPSRLSTLARTVFSGAYPVERRMMPEMFELLRSIVSRKKFDLVHLDHAHVGKYGVWLKETFGLPFVLREHNFEALIYERFASTQGNPLTKIVAQTHGRRLKIEELGFIRKADGVIPITEDDLRLMKRDVPEQRYTVIPAGVDTEYFTPSTSEVDPNLVLWIGGMGWDPNREAVKYFLSEIWPLILAKRPATRFEIIGDGTDRLDIPSQVQATVRTHGRVPDIRPHLTRAALMVVPLRVGGGMRLKILDFFSAGKAVVSTTIGAEGNLAKHGEQLLLADSSRDFAESVLRVLDDPGLRTRLGNSGRQLVEQYYSWEKIGREFVAVYEDVLALRNAPISVAREL